MKQKEKQIGFFLRTTVRVKRNPVQNARFAQEIRHTPAQWRTGQRVFGLPSIGTRAHRRGYDWDFGFCDLTGKLTNPVSTLTAWFFRGPGSFFLGSSFRHVQRGLYTAIKYLPVRHHLRSE